MPELAISRIFPFDTISPRIGKQRQLEALKSRILPAIQQDIASIVRDELGEFDILAMMDYLNQLFQAIQALPRSMVRSDLEQQVRFFVLVVRNRLDDSDGMVPLRQLCENISRVFGFVPELNADVPLPDAQFLPTQFATSVTEWANIIWQNPGRNSVDERIHFFGRRTSTIRKDSVRLHLLELDRNPANSEEALSYADADFYNLGDLQVDHLQPSDDIIHRQLELIAAMNIYSIFRDKMLEKGGGKGYFMSQDGRIFGSKRFFMEYHNCVGNLWFLNPNEGTPKSNQDPVEWLEKHPRFSERFLVSLGGKDAVDKRSILFTYAGELLADRAKNWFHATYAQEIAVGQFLGAHVSQPFLQQAAAVDTGGGGHVRFMARTAAAAAIAGDEHLGRGASSDDSSASIGSAAEINPANLVVMAGILESEREVLGAVVDRTTRGYKSAAKRRRVGDAMPAADDVDDADEDESGEEHGARPS